MTRPVRLISMAVLALSFLPQSVDALPPIIQRSDSDGDATVTLRVVSQTIFGDSNVWCEARIVVDGPLDQGDDIWVKVWEDDYVGDEGLWETTFDVSASEASADYVNRSFYCGFQHYDDSG
jgi:hypothetical protein